MIVISSENEPPEYVGYANCIEYKIKINIKSKVIIYISQIKTRRITSQHTEQLSHA